MRPMLRNVGGLNNMALFTYDNYAAKVTLVPTMSPNHSVIAGFTGLVTGTAANVPLVSITNSSAKTMTINRLRLQFITTTAFGTPQMVSFGLYVSRAITVTAQGGSSLTLTGNNNKLATSFASLNLTVIRTATTGTLTAPTSTLDSNPVGVVSGWSGGVGETIPPTHILDIEPGGHPIVLVSDEGLLINAIAAFGASGVGTLFWQVELQQ